MRILTLFLTILLIFSIVSVAWPLILGLVIAIGIMLMMGFFRLKKVSKEINGQWQRETSEDSWIHSGQQDQDEEFSQPYFEERVRQPEVIEAEYSERGLEDHDKQ